MAEKTMPDFEQLAAAYRDTLTNGQRAELRRVAEPDRLRDLPVFYQLVQRCGLQPNVQAGRLIYFLPYVVHKEQAPALGAVLRQEGISEKRLFQVLRADAPEDLISLRRLVRHAKPFADWREFGRMLYFWGKKSKRRLLQDYCLQPENDQKKSLSHTDKELS